MIDLLLRLRSILCFVEEWRSAPIQRTSGLNSFPDIMFKLSYWRSLDRFCIHCSVTAKGQLFVDNVARINVNVTCL